MGSRLDLILQKHPEHEDGIRLLALRDPSKNLKYIDWCAKALSSGQALAPEIADVVDLFHQFAGRALPTRGGPVPRRRGQIRSRDRIRPDIYTYRPQDLAKLRDDLSKIKRATDRKRRKRERLYHIEGALEVEVIYDSPDLIVRHIKNKQASIHYGLGTKWCIAMSREGYFEDYETQNATFFFLERKAPVGDQFDKVAVMVRRNERVVETAEAFTALDERFDMMGLVKVYGPRVFDIFRDIYERSECHPASAMFRVYNGSATQEQLEGALATVVTGKFRPHETSSMLRAICCNDAASEALLEDIVKRAAPLWLAACKRFRQRRRRYRRDEKELTRAMMAAVVIHPNVSAETRARFIKELRRRHVIIDTIARSPGRRDHIDVLYETRGSKGNRRRSLRFRRQGPTTVKGLIARAEMFARTSARYRKRARTLAKKLSTKKRKNR